MSDGETASVELSAQELLDISSACAYLASRNVGPHRRARYEALAKKAIRAIIDSDVDLDELRRRDRTP